MLKGDDFEVNEYYHKLQPYNVLFIKKTISDNIDEVDLALMKAQFQAEAELNNQRG